MELMEFSTLLANTGTDFSLAGMWEQMGIIAKFVMVLLLLTMLLLWNAHRLAPWMVAGPPCIRKVTPIASAASCSVAPALTAACPCEAMQPSQPSTTPIANAMSSLVFRSSAPSSNAAAASAPKPA